MSRPKQILSTVLTQNAFTGVNIWEVVDPRMVLWFDKIEWGLFKNVRSVNRPDIFFMRGWYNHWILNTLNCGVKTQD